MTAARSLRRHGERARERLRYRPVTPLGGTRPSWTCKDRLANPLRMSVWPVANHTRTPLGIGIMPTPPRRSRAPTPPSRCPPRRSPAVRTPGRSRSAPAFRWSTRHASMAGQRWETRRLICRDEPPLPREPAPREQLARRQPVPPCRLRHTTHPSKLSATIRRFSSSVQRRRAPVDITSTRATFDIGV